MGLYAAQFFKEVSTGKSVIEAAMNFYQNVLTNITQPLAQRLLDGTYKLTTEQLAAVMFQIDQQCYHADDFIAWGLVAEPDPAITAVWVTQIFAWVKIDQVFYTELVKTLNEKHTTTTAARKRAAAKG